MNRPQQIHTAKIAKERLQQSKHVPESNALESIKAWLPDADVDTRLKIVQALDKLGTDDALDTLVTLLADEDPDVQREIRVIFLRRYPRYTKKLHQAALKGDLVQRLAALQIIAEDLGPHHVPILGLCLRAKQPSVIQEIAAQILRAIQTPAAQEKLASWEQQQHGRNGRPETFPPPSTRRTPLSETELPFTFNSETHVVNHRHSFASLLNHIRDGNWSDQHKAAKAIHRLVRCIRHIPREDYRLIRQDFIDALGDREQMVRWVIIEALARLGDPETVPALLICLQDSSWTVRVATIRALIEIQDVAVVSQLTRMIGDHNANVQEAAVEAIGLLGTIHDVPLLVSMVDSNLEDTVRLAAIEAIRRLRGKSGVTVLLKALDDPNSLIRWHSAMVLSELADESCLHVLIDHLVDDTRPKWEDKRVCDWLIDALRHMDDPAARTAVKRWQHTSV